MNNLRSFVTLALLLCAAVPLAHALRGPPSVYISITNTGESDLGVFFVGNETERHPPAPPDGGITVAKKADSEVLIGMLQPGEHVQQSTHFDHAFVVRTADMAFRAKIIVNPGKDRPYALFFKNLMAEPSNRGPVMMELKNLNTGNIWINPDDIDSSASSQHRSLSHDTDADHDFQLGDYDGIPICTIRLKHAHDEL